MCRRKLSFFFFFHKLIGLNVTLVSMLGLLRIAVLPDRHCLCAAWICSDFVGMRKSWLQFSTTLWGKVESRSALKRAVCLCERVCVCACCIFRMGNHCIRSVVSTGTYYSAVYSYYFLFSYIIYRKSSWKVWNSLSLHCTSLCPHILPSLWYD